MRSAWPDAPVLFSPCPLCRARRRDCRPRCRDPEPAPLHLQRVERGAGRRWVDSSCGFMSRILRITPARRYRQSTVAHRCSSSRTPAAGFGRKRTACRDRAEVKSGSSGRRCVLLSAATSALSFALPIVSSTSGSPLLICAAACCGNKAMLPTRERSGEKAEHGCFHGRGSVGWRAGAGGCVAR